MPTKEELDIVKGEQLERLVGKLVSVRTSSPKFCAIGYGTLIKITKNYFSIGFGSDISISFHSDFVEAIKEKSIELKTTICS